MPGNADAPFATTTSATNAAPSTSAHGPVHDVRFYDADGELIDAVVDYLAKGAREGLPLVVVATAAHCDAFRAGLAARGVSIDVDGNTRDGVEARFLDARDALARFVFDGHVDREAMRAVARPLVARGDGKRVCAYGEMVDVLWRDGMRSAALRLEELWGELLREVPFTLLCGYGSIADGAGLHEVSRAHGAVHLHGHPPLSPGDAVVIDAANRLDVESALRAALLRTEKLSKITAALADAVEADAVYAAVVEECRAIVGADSAALWAVDAGGHTASMRRSVGYTEAQQTAFRNAPVELGRFPALDVIITGEPLWLDSRGDLSAKFPTMAAHITPSREYRVAIVPLSAGGRVLGSLGFTFDDAPVERGGGFDDDARDFVTLVARYAGQALERLRLLESEREARRAAEQRAHRASLLSKASRLFASSTSGPADVLRLVGQIVVEDLAESCGVMLLDDDGKLRVETYEHRDANAMAALREVFAKNATRLRALKSAVVLDARAIGADTANHVDEVAKRLVPKSLVAAPLATGGKTVGVLVAGRSTLPPFDDDDRALVQILAESAAGAIEKARLDEENHRQRARTELLYRLSDAMNRAARVDDVFAATSDAIARVGADRSSILVFDQAGVMRFRAWRGLSDEYRAAVEGHSPWKRTDKEFPAVVVSDCASDPAWSAYRSLFAREGIGALAFIPLLAGGALVGKFMMYWNAPHEPSSEELTLAHAIASHAAAAVARFSTVDELHQSVRFNEMFTGMLGHDLRNPLGAILTAAQLIVRRGDEKISKPVARIITSGERMSRMIDQLLDFTRVRVGGGIPLSPRDMDIGDQLRAILDEHDDASPGWQLELHVDGDARGHWDGDRLAQVFSNLVANAIQHGDPSAGVRVSVDGTSPDGVRVVVENAGRIPDVIVPALFEPMTRGATRREGARGLGLGLYITKQIVEAHRGRIEAASADTTRFTLWLPRS